MSRPAAIAIVGTGAVTAVGIGTAQTASSVRAGIVRFREIDFEDEEGQPCRAAFLAQEDLEPRACAVEGIPERGLLERLVRLAAPALREAAAPLSSAAAPALVLGVASRALLPEGGPRAMLEAVARQAGVGLDLPRSAVVFGGRAAALLAIREASARVSDRGAPVIAGGVDSYCDGDRLGELLVADRLLRPSAADGFLPGEGAGFVALARLRDAAVAAPPLALLSGTAEAFEEGHLGADAPMRGDGLAAALDALLSALPERLLPCRAVLGNLNGESLQAKQWGIASLRNRHRFADGAELEHPAEWFGDAGAAMGGLLITLAAEGLAREPSAPPVLVWCTADEGPCAAAHVEAAG